MKLRAYLDAQGLTLQAFGAQVGAGVTSIHRYCRDVIPPSDVMVRIYVATGGAVQPNDFFPLPDLPDLAAAHAGNGVAEGAAA